jgi:hypothetical protein
MPSLSSDLFFSSRLREAWNAGQKVVAAGKDPALPLVCQYADNSIVTASELANYYETWDIEIKDMEVYARAVRGCAAQREALKVAEEIERIIRREPGEYGKPLEMAHERAAEALKILDQGNVPTNRSTILDWVDEQEGVFDQKQMYQDLGLLKPKQKTIARNVLKRLVENDNLLERVKSKGSGWYRKRDLNEEPIDFLNVTDETIDLRLPFELDQMFKTRPKNIIVVAGDPDTGKSALALQIAKINQEGPLPIKYYSSEMGPNEFRSRLDQFEELEGDDFMAVEHWTNLQVVERSEDFWDTMLPDGLNIIDFLEIHEDFWAVGGMMKKIFDALDRGVAVVCIQKTNRHTDTGLGGARGVEKPRPYLSMKNNFCADHHTIKIVKCKAPRLPEDMNPTGLELDFKLIRGCKFIPVNPSSNGRYWHRPLPDGEREREDDNCFRSRV